MCLLRLTLCQAFGATFPLHELLHGSLCARQRYVLLPLQDYATS